MGPDAASLRGSHAERLLLAIGGQLVFACLVALAAGTPPALEATIAFGLALAFGLELQGRRAGRPKRIRRASAPQRGEQPEHR
jgi:hypothetical protein